MTSKTSPLPNPGTWRRRRPSARAALVFLPLTGAVLLAGCSEPTGQAQVTATNVSDSTDPSGNPTAGTAAPTPTSTSTTSPSSTTDGAPAQLAAPLPLPELLDTLADLHGPTDDLRTELNRLGYVDPAVPVLPGTLDVATVAIHAETGSRPNEVGYQVETEVVTATTASEVAAFYSEGALGDGWELRSAQPSRDGTTVTTYRSVSDPDLTFAWWTDKAATADGGTVLHLQTLTTRPITAPEVGRLAGWSPDAPVPDGAELTAVDVRSGVSALDPARSAVQITYTVPDGDGQKVVDQLAADLGTAGKDAGDGGSLRFEFDLAPLSGLTAYQLRVSELPDSGALRYDPKLDIIGSATLTL